MSFLCYHYATRNLQPVWYQGPPIPNGQQALNVAMNVLPQRFIKNGFGRLVSEIDYQILVPLSV
mgnify:CR=1 FL=1